MATYARNSNYATREPTELQLTRWEDDGGNQYIYEDLVFLNGKIISGRAAYLHQIISNYWEQLTEPKNSPNVDLRR